MLRTWAGLLLGRSVWRLLRIPDGARKVSPPLVPGAAWLLVGVGLLLRLLWFTGPVGSDDVRYLDAGTEILRTGALSGIDHAAGRLLFVVTAAAARLRGGHPGWAAALSVFWSVLADGLMVYFAAKHIGRAAAVWTAAIASTQPIALAYSGMILPDTLLAALLVLGVVLLHAAWRGPTRHARALLGFAVGLLFGLAYQAKEPALLALPPAGLVVALFRATGERRPTQEILSDGVLLAGMVGLGAAVMFVIDGAIYWHLSGDFFYKFTATRVRYNDLVSSSASLPAHLWQGAQVFVGALGRFTWTGAVLAVGLPAMLIAVLQRGPLRLVGSIGSFFLLYIIFGSSSFTKLVPLPFQDRYLLPLIPFPALCIAGLVVRAPKKLGSHTLIGPALVAALHLHWSASTVAPRAGNLYFARYCQGVSMVAELMREQDVTLYGDYRTVLCANEFVRPGLRSKIKRIPKQGPLPPGLYMIHPRGVRHLGESRAADVRAQPLWGDAGFSDAAFEPLGWARPEDPSHVPVYIVREPNGAQP